MLFRQWKKTDKIRMKDGHVLWRPFKCKEGFNSSRGLKNHTVCGFLKSPHTVLMTSFVFHQNVQAVLSHNCECTQLCSFQSSEDESCRRLSSENVNWIDVVCCHKH